MKRVNFFWKGQNSIIREILSSVKSVIQNYLQELLPQKQANLPHSSEEIMRAAAGCLNQDLQDL